MSASVDTFVFPPEITYHVPWAPPHEPTLPVCEMEEGGYVVRGTTDLLRAIREVVAYRSSRQEDIPDGWSASSVPPSHHSGWFRWNPCSPRSCWNGGGHRGHLDWRPRKGPGCWEGVEFSW